MLAAAAILSLVFDLSLGRVYVYPGYETGAGLRGGIELAHELRSDVSLSLTGRAGATYVREWRPLFEASAAASWRHTLDVHAGIRHDDLLRREGALAEFRDPTGRMFFGAAALPLKKGRLAAGAVIDYERALPGASRLPSSVSVAAIARIHVR